MSIICNSFAWLCHHKTSLRRAVQDFIISFNSVQSDIENVIWETVELIQKLVSSFNGKRLAGRLIAKINFLHINPETNREEVRSYHFTSYKSEEIENVEEFFVRHMSKIAHRLEMFAKNGSNLVIKNIEHIHIQLSNM